MIGTSFLNVGAVAKDGKSSASGNCLRLSTLRSGISWSLKQPTYGCASGSQLSFQNKSPQSCLNRIRRALAPVD
jgi:hypothetical protein